ncbi:MAG TPA: pentapeptide repeat-containing protein [Bacteroidia bacterium]|nr:pentapeptide repeat-containing protein [Bacteroidia bacterium]
MRTKLVKEWKIVTDNPNGVNLNFGEIPTVKFNVKNISECSITGEMSKKHRLNRTNIISSKIYALNAKSVSFNNSDIKDCNISLSKFDNCNFNHASHNNNLLDGNHYRKCTFSQTSITLTDFKNCVFDNCDFTNVIISDCRFYNCKFVKCITSNKVIESSLILDCSFKSTRIEYDTIIGNFGLTAMNCISCIIEFKGDTNKKYNVTQFSKKVSDFQTTNSVDRFKLTYFSNSSAISQLAEEVESLFNIEDWIKLSTNPNRFKLHIEKLHEFLLYQFDNDRVRLRTLIQLFDMSSKLSDTFARGQNFIDLQRTVDGVFLSLERILEKYLEIAENILHECDQEGYCRILVEGPLEKEYYVEELNPMLQIAPVKFGKIIKHNSPNELYIHWESIKDIWPWILFFFTTKFKFELNKLDQQTRRTRNRQTNILRDNQLIKIESTGLDNSDALSLKLKTLLPGHHELNIVMQFSLERYKRLMKTIKGWLSFDKKENEE